MLSHQQKMNTLRESVAKTEERIRFLSRSVSSFLDQADVVWKGFEKLMDEQNVEKTKATNLAQWETRERAKEQQQKLIHHQMS